jgi:hypothetical protein
VAKIVQFGEIVPEYPIPVINEREARAGAGILFFVAIVAFMNAWLQGNFAPTKMVVVGFLADFFIRVLINPRYAPSLILGRIMVRNQAPDFVGAPQKRFAWAIGLTLAVIMFYLVVVQNIRGPINILVCAACLILLFFESSFGICIGCKIYNLFNREKAQLCPGGACEVHARHEIQQVGIGQLAAALVVFVGLWAAAPWVERQRPLLPVMPSNGSDAAAMAEAERCKVPDFAKTIGHEEQWKLHNNCK